MAGRMPLWNPYEGLGSPLLGEMQAAALFPPTLLLLLPHGQVIEQAFLQIVAGIGTFLFLRRFGLGVTAALAGGLLFELNGVFAWLRNAIYNPVALLPWLFYATESLFAAARAGRRLAQRSGLIVLGAIAAALALYAGFPEVVYFYALPLAAWVAMRAGSLPWRRALAFLGDHALLAAAALLLAAPLLLAFWSYLAQGDVGPHQNAGFKGAILQPGGMLMYLLPYIYGPIYASPDPAVAPLWGNGGYLGVTTAILAIGGVLAARRRPDVWLLALWIAVAVGVSHGAPLLLDLFQHLPLVTVAAFCRYLNAGWLFCAVTLGAIFVDRVASMPASHRRRIGLAASGLAGLLLVGAAAAAWPLLRTAWQPHQGQRIYIVVSILAAAGSAAGAILATRMRPARAQAALVALALAEAVPLFAVPYASTPRHARVDRELVTFLQRHAGLQRVAVATGTGLGPNFGSAFGIPTINYDDLPVPQRTVAFVHRALDPQAPSLAFRPNATPNAPQADIVARLPAYARAGVRYALGPRELFLIVPSLEEAGTRAVPLPSGQSVAITLSPLPGLAAVAAVEVLIGTYAGAANGHLTAQICQADRCQAVTADLATAANNAPLPFAFAPPFPLADQPFQLTLSAQGGDHPVALWSKPPAPTEPARATGVSELAGLVPRVAFTDATGPRIVLETPTTVVAELHDPRPYASAPGCRVEARSHERMIAECESPSCLTRLEVLMDGWSARVNGVATPVALAEDVFQAIDLPAGRSDIVFTYDPPFVRPALWIAAATLLLLLATALATRSPGGRRA